MSNSINKIHVNANSSTRISLNDRFTVLQSFVPTNNQLTSTNQANHRKSPTVGGRRKRSNSVNRVGNTRGINGGGIKQVSLANRKFLEQLEKKHKMQTALKLKRRSLKAAVPPGFRRGMPIGQGQRLNRIRGYSGGRNRGGTIAGRLMRSNSFTNIATMKADLISSPVAGRLKGSNSTSNLAARLGTTRRNSAPFNSRRLRIRRGANNNNNNNQQPLTRGRSRSRQRTLSRSNSASNLNRSNSRSNFNRTNSQNSLNALEGAQRRGRSRSISRNRRNLNTAGSGRGGRGGGRGNGRFRSASRSRNNSQSNSSVHSRLGVKRLPINISKNRNLLRQNNGGVVGNSLRGGRHIAQGRIIKRKNSTAGFNNANKNTGVRQGRLRGRGTVPQGRNRSRSRGRSRSVPRGGSGGQRGNRRGRSRGRGGWGTSRGINRLSAGQKSDIKKEDLDKELDQYMATTKNSSDIEM